MADKKYYWLRLPKDFFDKHYIKILRSKEDSKGLILFYINLLTESIDHEAKLRYSDKEPYDIETLAEVTFTDEKIVTKAMPLFERLGLVEYLDDGTIFLPKGKEMIGCESSAAERMRNKREQERTNLNNVKHSDIEIELKIEKEIDINKKNSHEYIKRYSDESFEMKCVSFLIKSIKAEMPDAILPCTIQKIDKWCDHIEKMVRIDKHSNDNIYNTLVFARSNSFWKSNIRSTSKFREKYETLYIQMRGEKDIKPAAQQKPKQAMNAFNQFPQRTYTAQDYADLEKKLLNKGIGDTHED